MTSKSRHDMTPPTSLSPQPPQHLQHQGESEEVCETVHKQQQLIGEMEQPSRSGALALHENIGGSSGSDENHNHEAHDQSASQSDDDYSDSSSSFSSESFSSSSSSQYTDSDYSDDEETHSITLTAGLHAAETTGKETVVLDAESISQMLANARLSAMPKRHVEKTTCSLDGNLKCPKNGAKSPARISGAGIGGSTSHGTFSSRMMSMPDLADLIEEVGDGGSHAENKPEGCTPKDTNPVDVYLSVLKESGSSFTPRPASSITDFFRDVTEENIEAYTPEVIGAVQDGDISSLRRMQSEGRTLQCSNRFGESILHMACRRGRTEVVAYLLSEAGVSVQLRDDYGRTPMHDACWMVKPDMEMMELLIRACPDLLLVSDSRGYTPLHYVRREHWPSWCSFLRSKKHLLIPKVLESNN